MKVHALKKILVTFICSICFFYGSGQEAANFKKLEKTFSYNSKFVFDSSGHVWIAHSNGLYKYDGYDYFFTPYESIFEGRLADPRDIVFGKDSMGDFWLATNNGELTRITPPGIYTSFKDSIDLDLTSHRISTISSNDDSILFGASDGSIFEFSHSTSSIEKVSTIPYLKSNESSLTSIVFTQDGTFWASTDTGLVFKKSPGEVWELLEGPYKDPIGGPTKITSDSYGYLWIVSENKGFFSYDPINKEFKAYSQEGTVSESTPLFISIFHDDSGKIWAGTDGNGLYCVDVRTQKLEIFKHSPANRSSLSNNTVGEINKDPHGNIWVATKNGIIDILPYRNENVAYHSGTEDGVPTTILSVLVSSDGTLWIGTDGEGLNRVMEDGSSVQFNNGKPSGETFKGRYIQGLVEDSHNHIWIATYLNGLYVLDPNRLEFDQVPVSDSNGNPLTDIRFIFKDSKSRIWISTIIGVHVLSENKKQLAIFRYGNNGLSGDISESISETSDGTVWIGTSGGGLFRFMEKEQDFSGSVFDRVDCVQNGEESIIGLGASNILPDGKGNLYFKSALGSLIYFRTDSNSCENISEKQGFGNINVQSLLLDNSNKLWLGSLSGLHKYHVENDSLQSYYLTDGLYGNVYRRGAFKTKDGKLYFGTENGVNAFYPQNMVQRSIIPKLYINRIELLNKPAENLIPDQISNGIENISSLELKSNQSSFSFQFAAVANVLNTNYHYAYRLKGFDEEWIVPKSDRTATYTNIPSGDYVFEVMAGTKPNLWDIGKREIRIHVASPWWLSTMAFAAYFLMALLIAFAIYRWIHLKLKFKREEWAYKNEKELYAAKMNFFAKMSHEIQTPLSLILGPIDDMLQKASVNKNRLLVQRLNLIKNNAKRLSRISKDLTTIRNKELDHLKIQVSKRNIIKDLKDIAISFAEQARFKKIDFIQEFPDDEIMLWYDFDKIEHVFYNLLSNAFKFTPSEGSILLKVERNVKKERVKVSVIDSGPGIPKKELKEIFRMYYQSDEGKRLEGSGIGLALTKELIEMHHGKIKAKSIEGKGSSFHVYLSWKDDIFADAVKSSNHLTENTFPPENDYIRQEGPTIPDEIQNPVHGTYSILVVEDNVEMQIFLKELLQHDYGVHIAENGLEALKYLKDNVPDLIISDIMMPGMDGIKMTREIHKNKRISHIPIILLTAKNTTKTRLSGLKSGAVDFINKPFNAQELVLRVNSLMKTKENLISNAKTLFISNKTADLPPSKDHIFLDKLVHHLNSQMENPEFKLEHLADKMGMSYSVILRKCQDITGKTLIEFYRNLKIKRAAILILEQGYNISEAGFIVGYKDPKYFTKCFKDEFGTPPLSMKKESQLLGLEEVIKKYKLLSN